MQKNIDKEINHHVKNQRCLLDVSNLSVLYKMQGTYFRAVDDISFKVNKGDFFGIIGESGSGKSTIGKTIVRLAIPSGGKITFENKLISTKKIRKSNKRFLQSNIQMVFQDPMASLNYSKNVLQLVSEPLVINKSIRKKSLTLMRNFSLIKKFYWHDFLLEFSNLYKTFLLDYYQNWVNAYYFANSDDNLETDKTFDQKNLPYLRTNLFLEKFWLGFDIIEKFLNSRDQLISSYISKPNKNLNNIYFQYYELKKAVSLLKQELNHSPENIQLKQKNIVKQQRDEFLQSKNDLLVNGKELVKNWYLGLKNKIKVARQNALLAKNFIRNVYNNVSLMQEKTEMCFAKQLKLKMPYLDAKTVNQLITESEKIAKSIYKGLINKVISDSNNFLNQEPDLKNEKIKSLKIIKKFTKKFYSFTKKYFFKKNYSLLTYENFYNEFQNKVSKQIFQNMTFPISEQIFNEMILLLQSGFAMSQKNKTTFLKKKTDFQSLKKRFKETLKTNRLNFKANHEKIVDCQIALEQKQKELSELKQRLLNFKKEEQQKLKADLKHNSNFQIELKYVKHLKSKIWILKKEFKRKNNADILGLFQNREKNWKLWMSAYEIKAKVWKFYNKKIESLDQFKNFVIRESYYYKYAYMCTNFLKFLFLPLFRVSEKRKLVYNALESVGLKKEHAFRYPHEFSGGQRQRIVIARALITNPKLVIADEPISALDVSIQSQVINIMKKLAHEKGITFLFIAHDLSMVNNVCNKIIIMHRGKILEGGNVDDVFKKPIHPYTCSLMKAVPKLSRIHVDLASFEEKHTYDLNYSLVNIPKYHNILPNNRHYVFGTKDQIKEWVK